jgi:ubiquinone/menaquinone biosynthesis C-methylase UbiE
MPIDFHTEKNRYAYATRQADPSWTQTITSIVDPRGKRVVDIGCGGGIYSQAWMQLGAANVVGIDFSAQMIAAARERLGGVASLAFQRGDASATGLGDGCADIVFARALLHHVADLSACLTEAYRLLAPHGLYIIQDRTPEDVQLEGSREHLRGYFFTKFPRLLAVENSRRPRHELIRSTMQRAGFTVLATLTFWETRQIYPNFRALADDLRSRSGRSILHELSDAEMTELIEFVARHVPGNEPIVEKDRWTLWWGTRA